MQEKANGPSKSFMTVGPTLHYSHANVRWCWALATVLFAATCVFWTRIHTGDFLPAFENFWSPAGWPLHQYVTNPLSIYEYPWQILVISLLMGIMGVAPVLTSQLLSFRFSIPMILAVAVLARLPLFAGFLVVSCVAAACRPLRFRSRFIAIVLCMTPQLIYWTVFGGGEEDPVRWGFSYAPWTGAWLVGLGIAGLVIGIGHYTRYRPGLVWSITGLAFAWAVFAFMTRISFAELDYQLYIIDNNPEEVEEFHDHDLGPFLEELTREPSTSSFLAGLFYPTDPNLLHQEIRKEIEVQLAYDRWPNWLELPDYLKYQQKRQQLLDRYKAFIEKWPASRRMPTALYYQAMLYEYSPDIRQFSRREVLHFYSDYPHHENLPVWFKIFKEFPQSPESIEARYRYAVRLAGEEKFDHALEMCEVAEAMIQKRLAEIQQQPRQESFWSAFSPPPATAISPSKLRKLQQKLRELSWLIGPHNRAEDEASKRLLAAFVILNPYRRDYADRLDEMIGRTDPEHPLRDNLLVARAMLIDDPIRRTERLLEIHDQYARTDGGTRALYELGLFKVRQWKDDATPAELKGEALLQARTLLTDFLNLYADSIFADQARELLQGLPEAS